VSVENLLRMKEEGVISPKGPINEFYSQFVKLSGFGI
jgi:hypothetical protein